MTGALWHVLIPVKPAARAKSRLASTLGHHRSELALAFALDTVEAAHACPSVECVSVVTADPVLPTLLPTGVEVIDDSGAAGLNEAIAWALATLDASSCRVAVLLGDLPCLTPDELDLALALSADYETAFVPDAAGQGTTLLTARDADSLRPKFGWASAAAHADVGAIRLDSPGLVRIRRDVDQASELESAARLGVGRHTDRVLRQGQLVSGHA